MDYKINENCVLVLKCNDERNFLDVAVQEVEDIYGVYLKEYKIDSFNGEEVGSIISVESFNVGETISVTGKTIGKGFAGTVKRHNFTRGPMTHGSKNHREPGPIGMGTTPGRVYPGKKMAGRLGGGKTTIKNLQIILINKENNLLVIKGAVPGKVGNLLSIKKST
jgi:large subunit ribosomal protein L3